MEFRQDGEAFASYKVDPNADVNFEATGQATVGGPSPTKRDLNSLDWKERQLHRTFVKQGTHKPIWTQLLS